MSIQLVITLEGYGPALYVSQCAAVDRALSRDGWGENTPGRKSVRAVIAALKKLEAEPTPAESDPSQATFDDEVKPSPEACDNCDSFGHPCRECREAAEPTPAEPVLYGAVVRFRPVDPLHNTYELLPAKSEESDV